MNSKLFSVTRLIKSTDTKYFGGVHIFPILFSSKENAESFIENERKTDQYHYQYLITQMKLEENTK